MSELGKNFANELSERLGLGPHTTDADKTTDEEVVSEEETVGEAETADTDEPEAQALDDPESGA